MKTCRISEGHPPGWPSLGACLSWGHEAAVDTGPLPVFLGSGPKVRSHNPDANENGTVGSEDLLAFLSVYGSAFLPSGVLPVEGGGTGVSTWTARDSPWESARLQTGFHSVNRALKPKSPGIAHHPKPEPRPRQWASGLYAAVTGRGGTASGTYSFVANQNSTATATCSSAIGEGTTATSTAAHSQGLAPRFQGWPRTQGYYTVASSSSSHAEGYQTSVRQLRARRRVPVGRHRTRISRPRVPLHGLGIVQPRLRTQRHRVCQQRQRHRIQRHRRPSQQHGGWSMERLEPRWFAVCRGQRGTEDDRSDVASGHGRERPCRGTSVCRGFHLLQLVLNLQAQVDSMQTQLNLLQGEHQSLMQMF